MKSSIKSPAWIELLPPELLQIIFGLIHEDYKRTTEVFEWGLSRPEIDIDISDDNDYDDLGEMEVAEFVAEQRTQIISSKSPLLFPYCLAAVCGTWKNVLSSSPAFWTHLVLLIDSPPTPVEDARKYLEWSRHLAIDVFLLRSPNSRRENVVDSLLEQRTVQIFIDLLQPHMERCRSLHIDALSNISLPYLSEIIPNNAERLRSLHLNCQIGWIYPEDLEEKDEVIYSGPHPTIPRLQTMNLDGYSFFRACARSPPWFSYQPQLRHLGISRFDGPLPLVELDETLNIISTQFNYTLSSLSFSNVYFKVDTGDRDPEEYEFQRVRQLILEDIEIEAVSGIFRVCSFPRLSVLQIQNSSGLDKGIFENLDHSIRTIVLSCPTASDSEIIDFLSLWSGIALYLSLSQIPYDRVADALAESTGSPVLCPHLEILAFLACPIPPFASIKKMIEQRNRNVNYDDPDWKVNTSFGPAISTVEIKNCWPALDSPMWTQEEKDWLGERVAEFTWINVKHFPGPYSG